MPCSLPDGIARTLLVLSLAAGVSACAVSKPEQAPLNDPPYSDTLWVPDTGSVDNADTTSSLDKPAEAEVANDEYTVKAGDSLAGIAQRTTGNSANWQAIADYNDLANPNALRVGETLLVPPGLGNGRTAVYAEGQPVSAPDGFVDLLDVLSVAQSYDADFQAAMTSRSIAQRGTPIARSTLLPQVSLGYTGGYYDFKSDSSDEYVGHQLSLTLSQSIYDRANAIAVKQARLTGSTSDLELEAAHEDLVIRVAGSYFDVLKAMSELEYRQADVKATRLQWEQTRNRYEVGTIAETDVAEARAQADLAAASEITAKADLDAALQALEVSTGLSVNSEIAALNSDIPMESPDPDDVEAWVRTALANNKSLLVARNQIEIAQQQVAQTRAGRLPVVSLTGYLSRIDSDYDAGEDVSAEGYSGGSVTLGVDVPLATGGRITAQISQEQDRAKLAVDQTQAVERSVIQTTRDTYRGVVAAISRVAALSQARRSTRQATEATRSGFREGTRTSVDVLDSQRDSFRAQTELEAARYDYVLQVLELKRISGTLELDDIKRVNGWLG